MSKQLIKSIYLIAVVFMTSSCNLLKKVDFPQINFNNKSEEVLITETIEITISCDQGNIQTYLDKGWIIQNQVDKEIPCTWKTVKANKKCNLKRDKGCAITVPDILGIQTIYTLTKDTPLDKNSDNTIKD